MSGERIDYGIERQRHDGFVGRSALLTRLDQLLVAIILRREHREHDCQAHDSVDIDSPVLPALELRGLS